MHSPEPYGLLIDGDEPTERDSSFVGTLLRQLSNKRTVYQVESLRLVRDLPDGGYVIVQHMGGLLKAIIKKKGPEDKKQTIDGIAHGKIPMLFSGVFEKLTFSIDENYLPLHLSQLTRRRLSQYGSIRVPERINLNRFVVEYPPAFKYFEPMIKGNYFKHTQYVRLKPSWYSGAMGEVVQIVTGYGKPNNPEFPDDSIENSILTLPADVAEKVEAQLSKRALPGYTGYPHEEGHIQYDYKQSKNDVVSFDRSGKPWLVRISAGGVYAMPLPVIPATTTEAFREYMIQVQDDEILKILDRFGGMPSGETFPEGRAFQAWIRAGVIIKVCDAGDFYQHMPVYDAASWSMNSRGDEGFNTCYQMTGGRVEFMSYKVRLNLSPVQDQGWIKPGTTNSSNIFRYISDLYKLLDVSEAYDRAIIYKIKNAKPEEIQERASSYIPSDSGSQREFDYWDNYTAEPIAAHSGSLTRVGSGVAQLPIIKESYAIYALKFPGLTGEGCASFLCPAPERDKRPTNEIACDVVVFGCYVEDQLKVIKYFHEPMKFNKSVDSTFEDIMIVGQWEKTETTSPTGIAGNLYTSDFDDRSELDDSSIYTHIKGIDLGYGNPAFQTPGLLFTHGGLYRARYYKHEITTKHVNGNSLSSAVCVPNFNRDAILYAYQETIGSEVTTEEHEKHSITDPTSYDLWTYDPIFHYLGGHGKGKPTPKTGDYVYVYNMKYNPNSISDFADQGDWFGVGSGYIDVSAICAPYTDRAAGVHHANGVIIGGEAPYMEPYFNKKEVANKTSGYVGLTAAHVGSLTIHRNVPARWYFDFSPQDDGAGGLVYFQRDCCRVMFGDSSYVNISDEGGSAGRRKFWGHTRFANHSTYHYFFGVINE